MTDKEQARVTLTPLTAAQAAGESTEQKIARLEISLAEAREHRDDVTKAADILIRKADRRADLAAGIAFEQAAKELDRIGSRNKALAESESGTVGFAVQASFAAAYYEAAAALRAHITDPEAVRKVLEDAARYRKWIELELIDEGPFPWRGKWVFMEEDYDTCDAAIDAARKEPSHD